MATHRRIYPETHVRSKKRKRQSPKPNNTSPDEGQESVESAAETADNCTICLRYNSMLYMDCLANNDMLVVAAPPLVPHHDPAVPIATEYAVLHFVRPDSLFWY